MAKKERITIQADSKIIVHKGKMFAKKYQKTLKIDGIPHIEQLIFEEVTDKDLKEAQKITKFIVNKLKNKVSKKDIMNEIIKQIPSKEQKRLYEILKLKHAKVKKQRGCLGLLIDAGKRRRAYVQLYE